ncbi:hypothetical protein [Chondrinema litorale]|uniref:rhamnogalacturonan lyase family protein n=1 Tax=Chondrinema litorale TaxID=2994555 RepID=UPI0025426F26|nr:hypothetical protein [Chondrinema litorale]
MHDPLYRMNIARQNIGYNQPAHTGYFFADGAPTPNITTIAANSNVIQENENGFCFLIGDIDSDQTGYSGAGYANTINFIGSSITWSVSVEDAGTYDLNWRFANGSNKDRKGIVLINGHKQNGLISFPSTND